MARSELFFSVREEIEREIASIVETGDVKRIDHLEKEIIEKPKYPDLRYQVAYLHYLKADFTRALDQLQVAIELNPRFVDAWRLRATIFSNQGRLTDAIQAYRRLVEFAPNDADGHYRLAVLLNRAGAADEAFQCALRSVEKNPNLDLAHIFLAERFMQAQDWEKAISHYESATTQHPQEEWLYILGLLYLKKSDLSNATKSLERALALKPNHLNSSVRLSMIHIAEGEYEKARLILQSATTFFPRYPDLLYSLAKVCLLLGRRDEAYELMKSALDINPKYAEVRREMGYLYSVRNMSDQAVDQLKQSIEINPNDEQAYLNLGFVYSNQGEHERALQVLSQSIARFPNSWRLYQSLGIVHLQERSFPKAKQAFAVAIQINPELEAVQRGLRIAFQDESLLDEERERLLRSYNQPDQQGELDFHLGNIHLDFHKEKAAINYLQRSLNAGYERTTNSALLGIAYANLQSLDLAIKTLEEISDTGLRENLRRLLLGLFHANAGDHELSGRYYQMVMSESPLFFHSLDSLGVCFREYEELDDMLDDYMDYARFHERSADLYCRIGQIYTQKGMLVEARQQFHHATVLDPNHARAYHASGILMMFRMNFGVAADAFLRAIDKDPAWPMPHLNLSYLYLAQDRPNLAAISLRRYINLETDEMWREQALKLAERNRCPVKVSAPVAPALLTGASIREAPQPSGASA